MTNGSARAVRSWLVVIAVSGAAVPARAQQPQFILRGTIRSAADSLPLPDVLVRSLAKRNGRSVVTSSAGRFRLGLVQPKARLLIARLGFRPESLAVAADTEITVYLQPRALGLSPIVVAAEPALTAASSRAVRELDLHLRPRETAQDLLALAPGLVIAQHAGGGKAEQIFLRGFDADHGTDVAISVDGVPVNLVSHAHGQGYADLHFLMPELVERGDVRKGPYDAADGDLATAGAVAFHTRDRLEGSAAELRAASFGTIHGMARLPLGSDPTRPGGYIAGSVHRSDGPFVSPQRHQRWNGFGKFTVPAGIGQLELAASSFGATWDASGQIPERAVLSGSIDRFGAIDDTEGGTTRRDDIRLGIRSLRGNREWEAQVWAARYSLQLFSNFTFFLVDSVDGDGIEQLDHRTLAGVTLQSALPLGTGRVTTGGGLRADFADVALHWQTARVRRDPIADARVEQQHYFGWLRHDLPLGSSVRLQLGIRGDLFHFGVEDRLEGSAAEEPHRSGTRTEALVSPKANLAVQLGRRGMLFANAGMGFHSNDARGVINAGPEDRVLPRALSAEAGSRYSWEDGSVAASLWGLDLESELVWVGDEGTTEPGGRTRRVGLDLEGRTRLLRWLWADLDLTLSRGRLRDEPEGSNRIPLAPTLTSSAGLTVRELGDISGGMRMRHIGDRAAIEDNSVRALGHTVVEIFATWNVGRLRLTGSVDNLFAVDWNEAQFATTSRLSGEPAVGITELQFTPGTRRAVQVGIHYRF